MHPLIHSIQEETGYRDARAQIAGIPSLAKRIKGLETALKEGQTPALATRYRRLLSQAVAAAAASASPRPPENHNGPAGSVEVLDLKEEYNLYLRAWEAVVEDIMPRCEPKQPLEFYGREEKHLRKTLGDIIGELKALGVHPSRQEITSGFNLQEQQRLPMQ